MPPLSSSTRLPPALGLLQLQTYTPFSFLFFRPLPRRRPAPGPAPHCCRGCFRLLLCFPFCTPGQLQLSRRFPTEPGKTRRVPRAPGLWPFKNLPRRRSGANGAFYSQHLEPGARAASGGGREKARSRARTRDQARRRRDSCPRPSCAGARLLLLRAELFTRGGGAAE